MYSLKDNSDDLVVDCKTGGGFCFAVSVDGNRIYYKKDSASSPVICKDLGQNQSVVVVDDDVWVFDIAPDESSMVYQLYDHKKCTYVFLDFLTLEKKELFKTDYPSEIMDVSEYGHEILYTTYKSFWFPDNRKWSIHVYSILEEKDSTVYKSKKYGDVIRSVNFGESR